MSVAFVQSLYLKFAVSSWSTSALVRLCRIESATRRRHCTLISQTQLSDDAENGKAADLKFMRLALTEAEKAYEENEVPIGAILVNREGTILASAHNQVEALHDCTRHAELTCLQRAMTVQKAWRMPACTMYCTLEPCAMCLSALALARVPRIVYAAPDLRLGACGSWINLPESKHPFHSFSDISSGLLAEQSASLLRQFFKRRRTERARHSKGN